MKSFIITIDTEGDNLWHYNKGDAIKTENANYIPRFQELCNRFGFKPVWLTNYEMAKSTKYVDYIGNELSLGHCEVGIHLHAWNNPPLYELNGKFKGNPYLIEYPDSVMKQKFEVAYCLIKERFGIAPTSHRSGRWAMDKRYFQLLEEFGITCDCSYTPGISWAASNGETITGGSDYTKVPKNAHMIGNVLEVPVSIRHITHFLSTGSIKHRIKSLVLGGDVWLRPALCSLHEMKILAKEIDKENDCDYLEFMLHSSELMPGGSPYFTNPSQIEELYKQLEEFFNFVVSIGYKGLTLQEYTKNKSRQE